VFAYIQAAQVIDQSIRMTLLCGGLCRSGKNMDI